MLRNKEQIFDMRIEDQMHLPDCALAVAQVKFKISHETLQQQRHLGGYGVDLAAIITNWWKISFSLFAVASFRLAVFAPLSYRYLAATAT